MGSALGVICGLAALAMLAAGIRAEAKHKAQRQQRARFDLDATVSADDIARWEAEMEGWER